MRSFNSTELLPLSPAIDVWQAIAIAVGYLAIGVLLVAVGLSNIPIIVDWIPAFNSLGLVWFVTSIKTDVGFISAFELDVRTARSRELLWKGFKYAFLIICFQSALICVIAILFAAAGHSAPEEPAYKEIFSWKSNSELISKFAQIGFVAPFCEEMLARGLLFAGLRKKMGFMGACLISSALFGVGHMYPVHIVMAFSLGVILCRLAEKTKSLLPGVVCHVMLNSFVMGVLILISMAAPSNVPKAKKEAADSVQATKVQSAKVPSLRDLRLP